MRLGIFAKTFVRPAVEQVFEAAKSHGLDCIQLNFSCAGLPTLPESLDVDLLSRIRSALQARSLSMPAVSGTCNLIHPNTGERAKDINKLAALVGVCGQLPTSLVTLCSGTRDPADMWRAHPQNHSPEAWRDLRASLERILPVAQEHRVFLGIEPEPANVVDSATRARKLLDELQSPWLKIVFDAANLLQPETLIRQDQILAEGLDLLRPDIVLAHAKDLATDRFAGPVAAGRGSLDYPLYVSLLKKTGFEGPLILHSLREDEVPAAVAFLREVIQHA